MQLWVPQNVENSRTTRGTLLLKYSALWSWMVSWLVGSLVGWLVGWSVSELVRHHCHPGPPRVISGHSEKTF